MSLDKQQTADYYTLSVELVPTLIEEEVSLALFEMGASGVHQDIPFTHASGAYLPETVVTEFIQLNAYFDQEPAADELADFVARYPSLKLQSSWQQNQDWMEIWKKGFAPLQLTHQYWVVPSWFEAPQDVEPLFIDPGMAFGSGTHETTQLCAEIMYLYRDSIEGENLLDVGTGSAILSILAEMLGAQEVVGLEIDEMARSTARENIQHNNCRRVSIPDTELSAIQTRFGVVVANIVDGVLIQLKPDLLKVLDKDKGLLILSGIIHEREEIFTEQFLKDPQLKILYSAQKGDWHAYVVKFQ